MTNWIPYPQILTGRTVDLISLERQHFPTLISLASDSRIWEHYIFDGTDPGIFSGTLETALIEREKGAHFPFVIFHKAQNKLIGSTRFMDIQPKHKKHEIGSTWLHPDYWGTVVNLECKLLMLSFCFETLGCQRVQFKTDENNIRSRKAIEKIGGKFEGILRNDMVRDNNTRRHSAYYSIIEEEWLQKKLILENLLKDNLL
jgi:RimJ/RimL family protein N-acetyltransferase